MVYTYDFLNKSLSSHDQSVFQKQGLYTTLEVFKKISIFNNSFLCTHNDVKQIISKTQPVNGVHL